MALAHSRGTLCAAPRCVPRITVVVIRSAAKTAMSQARTSLEIFFSRVCRQAGLFVTTQKVKILIVFLLDPGFLNNFFRQMGRNLIIVGKFHRKHAPATG